MIPEGTIFLKLVISNDANVWTPQIGQVTLFYNKNIVNNEFVLFNTYKFNYFLELIKQ